MKLFKIWEEEEEPLETIQESAKVAADAESIAGPSYQEAFAALDKLEIGETYTAPWGAEMTRVE